MVPYLFGNNTILANFLKGKRFVAVHTDKTHKQAREAFLTIYHSACFKFQKYLYNSISGNLKKKIKIQTGKKKFRLGPSFRPPYFPFSQELNSIS